MSLLLVPLTKMKIRESGEAAEYYEKLISIPSPETDILHHVHTANLEPKTILKNFES